MSLTTHEIIEESNKSMFPFMAMVAYKNRGDDVYIESHNIDEKGRMLAGVPLTLECITEIAATFTQEISVIPKGEIPSNMLFCDSRIGYSKYIWYNPPGKQMMYFSKELAIPNGEYYIPGVIYVVQNKSLDIYAFKGTRPEKTDKLFKAPFFNVNTEDVCLGNATLDYPKNPGFYDIIAYWEKMFWKSEFSHLWGGNPTKTNLPVVIKRSKKSFDEDQLVGLNITLNDLLR